MICENNLKKNRKPINLDWVAQMGVGGITDLEIPGLNLTSAKSKYHRKAYTILSMYVTDSLW